MEEGVENKIYLVGFKFLISGCDVTCVLQLIKNIVHHHDDNHHHEDYHHHHKTTTTLTNTVSTTTTPLPPLQPEIGGTHLGHRNMVVQSPFVRMPI